MGKRQQINDIIHNKWIHRQDINCCQYIKWIFYSIDGTSAASVAKKYCRWYTHGVWSLEHLFCAERLTIYDWTAWYAWETIKNRFMKPKLCFDCFFTPDIFSEWLVCVLSPCVHDRYYKNVDVAWALFRLTLAHRNVSFRFSLLSSFRFNILS